MFICPNCELQLEPLYEEGSIEGFINGEYSKETPFYQLLIYQCSGCKKSYEVYIRDIG